MRALLLRHGESAHNANTAAEPLDDEAGDRLTELGREQAATAAAGLAGYGVTELLCSPMRRAAETAEAVGAGLGLNPRTVAYAHELGAETFEQAVARVQRLKGELEVMPDSSRPLLVTHGIFIRFFLLDSILAEEFKPTMAGRIWHLRSHNCGLSEFEPGGAVDPAGGETPGWTCLSWMERPWDPPLRS
jgi:broad specificity phosphatase PhoE